MIPYRPARPKLRHASYSAAELLERARRQAEQGPDDMDRYLLVTGLPALDAVMTRWPGVSLVLGPERRAKTVLSSQFAFETARTGKPVLWLCAAGQQDFAVLMMMCRLARLDVRRVFVKRDLRPAEWRRLRAAALALSKLPLHLADVRGANADEIEDALCRSRSESPVANQLLVIDHLDAPPKPILQHLEAVSETLLAPFLVILEENAGVGRPPAVHETGLRPGSRALVLERASASLAPCESAGRRDADLVLRVQHVGSGYCEQTIALKYDAAQARISASAQDG